MIALHQVHPGFRWAQILSLILMMGVLACKAEPVTRTTPKGAFTLYVTSAREGNYEAIYPMIVRDLQDKIAATYQNVQTARHLIEANYPPALRNQALADLGRPEVRNADHVGRYFAALVGSAGKPALSTAELLSSRLKRIEEKDLDQGGGRFILTTVSGATLEFVRGGDDLYYMVPNPEDVQLLHREYLRSIERLAATQSAVASFRSQTNGPARVSPK